MDSSDTTPKPHKVFVAFLLVITLWMSLFGLAKLPVIDRDEARYAQATVQMLETDDYINIRFQDRARNKKPAGIYWMQAASVKAFSDPDARTIWAHRLPSVLGAIMAVLATYWGALAILSRREAFIAGAILATSALFVFEAHIAKTDAMLCGFSALALAAMLHLKRAEHPWAAVLFWIAIGGGIMIKGPITPALIILTLIGLAVWERQSGWMRRLLSWPGIIIALLMVLPWSFAIWTATDGAFFKDAIGGDLAPKLAGGQEKHGAPPGYYLGTLPILFWPGSLLLIAGLWFGVKQSRLNSNLSEGLKLLLCWVIPFWVILELVPTKLPNYLLPTYPALAILCAAAIPFIIRTPIIRRVGGLIFLIIAIALIVVFNFAEREYGSPSLLTMGLSVMALILAFWATVQFWKNKVTGGIIVAALTTALLTPLVYQHILPNSQTLLISPRVQNALENHQIKLPRLGGEKILSPHFTEPSLVYYLGTEIVLGDKITAAMSSARTVSDIILLDRLNENFDSDRLKIQKAYTDDGLCLNPIEVVRGINYSKGDTVEIEINQLRECDL